MRSASRAANRGAPKWLVDRVGVDYFGSPIKVRLRRARSGDLPAQVGQLGKLEFLRLESSSVTDSGLMHRSGLTHVKRLYLTRTKVGDSGLGVLTGMSTLRVLHLQYTTVTDDGMKSLEGLAELEELAMSDTRVSDKGLAAVQN